MKSSVMLALGAALAVFGTRSDHRAEEAPKGPECPVCDHPFGDSAHMCLASGSSLGV